eukprot:TRINITY_DN11129_c0_g1_i3.p3 TRINITY_DN11129_c0_g1~~TRINITY_DN11129_c0_g1_i3.p3  ORF type:complete len:120 (-),score=36.82 TRINITY_DN11129_c0_g1_i3:99-458(-)
MLVARLTYCPKKFIAWRRTVRGLGGRCCEKGKPIAECAMLKYVEETRKQAKYENERFKVMRDKMRAQVKERVAAELERRSLASAPAPLALGNETAGVATPGLQAQETSASSSFSGGEQQ